MKLPQIVVAGRPLQNAFEWGEDGLFTTYPETLPTSVLLIGKPWKSSSTAAIGIETRTSAQATPTQLLNGFLFSKSGPNYPSPTRPKSRLHSDVAPRLHRAADGGSPAQETHWFLSVFPSQNLRHEVADEFILDTRLFQKCFSTRLSNGTINTFR